MAMLNVQTQRPATVSPYAGINTQTNNQTMQSDASVSVPDPAVAPIVPDTPPPAVAASPAVAGAGRTGTNTSASGTPDPAMLGLQAAAPSAAQMTANPTQADDLLAGPSTLRNGIGTRQSSFQANSLAAQGLRNAY